MSSNLMRETFKLPKLPGNGFQEEMMKKSFKKRQMMQPLTGPRNMDIDRIPVDFESVPIQGGKPSNMQDQEAGLTLDRKVLRFTGYFREGVHESRLESERVRRCVVRYFLEDDTISVTEPREDNAGMTQGCMLKRHQVPKDAGGYCSFEDLNVGQSVTFYGKCFHLCDCDKFTRDFLAGLGIDVPDAEEFPTDAYQSMRARPDKKPRDVEDRHLVAVMEYTYSGKRSRLSPEELHAAKQFLLNDRKVLKFKAKWNDSTTLYGDDRRFTLYYFLADDTIEVTEDLAVNAGRDPFPSFVRRRKCAKPTGKYDNPKASLSFKNDPQVPYTDSDLFIGAEIEVFGRKFQLISCDPFTTKYLQTIHGREPCEPLVVDSPPKPKVKPVAPPYNGFGDEEDSLGSWKNLVLKPPKKNAKQFIENSGSMLKFSMRMESSDPANEVRRFVLTYYLTDDTVSIFEPAQRNSGIIGGKFLQRTKGKRSDTGTVLKAADLFIGARIEVNHHKFIIFATDEKSLAYMEQNSSSYNHSDINSVMLKIRSMLLSSKTGLAVAVRNTDQKTKMGIDYKVLVSIFSDLGLPVSEHEVLTVLRFLDVNNDGSVTYEELMHCALAGEHAASIDEPWQRILSNSETDVNLEKSIGMSEELDHGNHIATASSHLALFIMDKYNDRKTLFNNACRNEADHSPDGKVGEKEFINIINSRLKLNCDVRQLKAICSKILPKPQPRHDLAEVIRILQGTSLHGVTIPSLAAEVKRK
eukprot:TRINITY_DN5391_c1_g1_i1.p1 TRINITY_DN5391_c1_g1~~TRINITY_DN5391_c1_g1_i1.p1  ORF type:complete len:797 (+),score=138.55 TRINITY_DN5391_c1_g1_i1:144-2393(+)